MLQEKHWKKEVSNMKFILLFMLLSITYFAKSQNIKCDSRKLLIYPIITGDTLVNISDSALFFNDSICLTLKIDTININNIEKIRENKYAFRYKGHVHLKKQIFPLSKYNDLIKFKITRFTVATTEYRDIKTVKVEGECLSTEQKEFIYTSYRLNKEYGFDFFKKKMFYIENMQLFNGVDHFIEINYGWVKFK